jgi:hypothetical protein
MATNKKKTKKTKDLSSLAFRLDGEVSFVETDKDGKETVLPLDGNVVLQCLMNCLEQGMDLLEEKECTKSGCCCEACEPCEECDK